MQKTTKMKNIIIMLKITIIFWKAFFTTIRDTGGIKIQSSNTGSPGGTIHDGRELEMLVPF